MDDDMDDDTMANTGDATDGVRSLTYAELAKARGISKASATRLAFRRCWRRTPGNDGHARVAVPLSALVSETSDPDAPHDAARGGPLTRALALLAGQTETASKLAQELDQERGQRARAELELAVAHNALAMTTAQLIEAKADRAAAQEALAQSQSRGLWEWLTGRTPRP